MRFIPGSIFRHASSLVLMLTTSLGVMVPAKSTISGVIRQSHLDMNRNVRKNPVLELEGARQGYGCKKIRITSSSMSSSLTWPESICDSNHFLTRRMVGDKRGYRVQLAITNWV